MIRRSRNWKRLLIGGAVASGLLTSMLYGLVILNMLSKELAIPWVIIRDDAVMVDWTCLFLSSLAIALIFGCCTSNMNGFKGTIAGLGLAALLILTCVLLDEKVSGIGYYMICYLAWGWCFGFIYHQKPKLIIRQF